MKTNTIIDLSNNEQFMEYFFDDNYNIPEKETGIIK